MSRYTEIRSVASTLYRCAMTLTACLAAWIAVGCSGSRSDASAEPIGTLSMQLSTDVNGVVYRLSAARFDVIGPVDASFDSDEDPDLRAISATLPRGDYSILLRDGWRLLRQSTPDAVFEAVEAELASENPRLFTINEAETTNVAYVFETNGVIVDLGNGFLEVSIEVVETGAGGSGGSGGTGGSGGSGGGPVDREQIAADICESFANVPNCAERADCVQGILNDMSIFDSFTCPELVDAFFACVAGAPAASFECAGDTPQYIIGDPACIEEETALFTNLGTGICP